MRTIFKRKRLLLLAMLIGLPAGFLVWRFYWLGWSAEKLILSQETTYITAPLDEAGYPDYYAALNERMSQGVTPENNAAVALLQAFGPSILPDDVDRDEFFFLLRMKPLPRTGRYFEDWVSYGKRLPPELIPNLRPEEDREHEDRLWLIDIEIGERPWHREKLPYAAEWLDAQQPHLDQMVAASKRPRFYVPLVRQGDSPLMLNLGAALNIARGAVMALDTRARFRTGERDFRGAWEDLMASHRIARLHAQGSMISDAIIAKALDAAVFYAEADFLGMATFDPTEWATIRAEFDALPPFPSFAEKLDLGYRFSCLDAIGYAARRGIPAIERAFYGEVENRQSPTPFAGAVGAVDWNVPLRMTNQWINRYVEAAKRADPFDQSATFTALDWEAQAESESSAGILTSVVSQGVASERMGNIFIATFFSTLASSDYMEERNRAYRPLVRVGLALAHYNSENGSYPTKLSQLSPKYLKSIPQDPYGERPFRYRKTGDGYRMNSVGWNRRDDGGKGYNNDDESDDLFIEVPYAKPKPSEAETSKL